MAVVQISRIQQRRGKKNDGTGLPQLASGELAWAIDTQELYVGNGSVSEGAPAVGNTKILTEHDDLLSLISKYQYAKNDPTIQTGPDANYPVLLSIQQVLDQFVTINDFITEAEDTAGDYTAAIQRAVDQLFLNPATQGDVAARVTLQFNPGTYAITDTIYIPSYATLVGAGQDKTIISYTGTGPIVKFIDDTSTIGNYVPVTQGLYQPREIVMKGITFKTNSSNQIGLQLESVKDSVFENIKVEGPWVPSTALANSIGIKMQALSAIVTCERNIFSNVEITGFSYGIIAEDDIMSNKFEYLNLYKLYQGIVFGPTIQGSAGSGKEYGPRNTLIQKSIFGFDATESGKGIVRQGILIKLGQNNISYENQFTNVGCNLAGNSQAKYAHIDFVNTVGNASINDRFDRINPNNQVSMTDTYLSTPFAPAVNGHTQQESSVTLAKTLSTTPTKLLAFRLPVPIEQSSQVIGSGNIGYEISYSYVSTGAKKIGRSGKMYINANAVSGLATSAIQLVDEYEYTGPAGDDELRLDFTAELVSTNSPATARDTIQVSYKNPNDNGIIYYSFRSIS